MQVIDPLTDARWDGFIARHPCASAFHSHGWLKSLALTYGFEPLALTSSSDTQSLQDAVLFCRVRSWVTGSRLVSVPFADHCEPLLQSGTCLSEVSDWIQEGIARERWKYAELRPLSSWNDNDNDSVLRRAVEPSAQYWYHELDLGSSTESLFGKLHKDSIQRKIQRAQREQLECETGTSVRLIDEFYRLLVMTRKRHHLLPQPLSWFRNLVACMGDGIQIRVARKRGTAIAAIIVLRQGHTVIYKYGCSDQKYHNLGGMPLLFWKLIDDSKAGGARRVDFGRTDLDQTGLMTFKERFGATRHPLTYYRRWSHGQGRTPVSYKLPGMRRLFSILPASVSAKAGGIVYRHLG